MSKMDNLRAMREARYEQARSRGAQPPTRRPVAPTLTAASDTQVSETPEPEAALCGHRNMGGRTCTREAGHAAKSHRYS